MFPYAILSTARQNLTLSIAFCDPGVRWFSVPRFSVAHPEVQLKDDLYESGNAGELLSARVYDLIVTPYKIQDTLSMCINFVAIVLSLMEVLTPTTGALVHNAGSCFVVLVAALLYDRKFE